MDQITEEKKNHLIRNSYAGTLRDIADRDYVSARTLFRNQCKDQFLYMAQQAVEKYLKSALLFHQIKHQKGHKLLELREHFITNVTSKIKADKRIENFIRHLEKLDDGVRYLSSWIMGLNEDLQELDYVAWRLRKYCQPDKKTIGLLEDMSDENLKKRIRKNGSIVFGGVLEKIFQNKKDERRKNLLWFNNFYSSFKNKKFPFGGGWSRNSLLFLGDDERQVVTYEALKDYLLFPSRIKNYFENLKKNLKKT